MLEQILDLHIHSKYARACSNKLELPNIAKACSEKGIDIVATGDFTHPRWFAHLQEQLVEENEGVYVLKEQGGRTTEKTTRFIFGTEVSCIYKDKDKVRRLHLLLYAPTMECAAKLNVELDKAGVNRSSDGRPIFGMTAKDLLKLMLEIDPRMMMIPAHAWTPWFAIFGSKSGYDSIEECFEELSPEIFAIETGLSSDPPMNHRLSRLDNIVLISNSDAHSLGNLGREANVFNFKSEKSITYSEIRNIIKRGNPKEFVYTIEFYPEEGIYHFDGHRECKIRLRPDESKKIKDVCPVCKKKLTIGVLHRVDDLGDRRIDDIVNQTFIPHRYIVPLREIIAASFDVGKTSKKVVVEYERMIKTIGSEFYILLHATEDEIKRSVSNQKIALGIMNVRTQKVSIDPGYDGVYGTVDVFGEHVYTGPMQSQLL